MTPQKPNNNIFYLDTNNLYGWAMSQPLPVSNFRWVEDCDRLVASIGDQPADSPEGLILEVDLGYSEELHRRLIVYPAFARANIFDDDLAAIQVHKSRLVLNRPVYVGMSVYDL